ncbi:MAG: hypothetical protein JNL69_11110 [Bacteroidia bacterium]|nr:hypothetical protein [Bacteroidia bacterium]
MNMESYKKANLLYINDNQFDTLLVQSLISPHFNVFYAESMEKAISILCFKNIDVLVIDEKINQGNKHQTSLFLQIKRLDIIEESKIFVLASSSINDVCVNQEEECPNIFIKPLIKEDIYLKMQYVA